MNRESDLLWTMNTISAPMKRRTRNAKIPVNVSSGMRIANTVPMALESMIRNLGARCFMVLNTNHRSMVLITMLSIMAVSIHIVTWLGFLPWIYLSCLVMTLLKRFTSTTHAYAQCYGTRTMIAKL